MAQRKLCGLVDEQLVERVRDAAYWERLTIGEFLEQALREHLAGLEEKRGSAYPKRTAELTKGRRLRKPRTI